MWHVQDGSDIKVFSEEKLRKKLRKRNLSGLELARRDDAEQWVPLHDTDLFRQEVPVVGSPREAAKQRAKQGLVIHALTFACVLGGITVNAGFFPFWGLFWGLGLVFHANKVFRSLGRDAPAVVTDTANPALDTTPATPNAHRTSADPFLTAIEGGLRESGLAPDVQAELLAEATAMHERLQGLRSLVSPGDIDTLCAEASAARARAEGSDDERNQDVFLAEAEAIDQRRQHLENAATLLARLEAQQRTLLHQVEGLRLGSLQAETPEAPDLADRLDGIRAQMKATAEVDQTLARARMASRQKIW